MSIDTYTKLLMHLDNDYIDIAEHGTAVTAGTIALSAVQYKFGGKSALLDGNSDYFEFADSADWDFADGDFTLECFVYFNGLPTDGNSASFINQWATISATPYLNFSFGTRMIGALRYLFLRWSVDGANDTSAMGAGFSAGCDSDAVTLATGQWYHTAFARSGNTGYFFLDGTPSGDIDLTGRTLFNTTSKLVVGARQNDTYDNYLNGYIDEVRISKGIARWVTTFTPPVRAYGTNRQQIIVI